MKANYYLSDLKVSLTIKSYWPDQSTVKCNYHLTPPDVSVIRRWCSTNNKNNPRMGYFCEREKTVGPKKLSDRKTVKLYLRSGRVCTCSASSSDWWPQINILLIQHRNPRWFEICWRCKLNGLCDMTTDGKGVAWSWDDFVSNFVQREGKTFIIHKGIHTDRKVNCCFIFWLMLISMVRQMFTMDVDPMNTLDQIDRRALELGRYPHLADEIIRRNPAFCQHVTDFC